jgi:hypothetical protein
MIAITVIYPLKVREDFLTKSPTDQTTALNVGQKTLEKAAYTMSLLNY